MKKLTKRQEINILNAIRNRGESLGHGSSRAVFQLGANYCIKVAKDSHGIFQNKMEVEAFSVEGNDFLAEIKAYSEHIIIMEYVRTYDTYDVDYYLDFLYCMAEDDEWEDEISLELVEQMASVCRRLDSIFGETLDNKQLGLREKDYRIVAYDYGYRPDKHEESVGNLYDEFIDKEDFIECVFENL